MAGAAVRFIRKNGRIIPIRAATGVAAVGAVSALRKTPKEAPPLHPNKIATVASTALAVGAGAVAGASWGKGARAVGAFHVANEVADVASTGLAFGAFAGKGRTKERIKRGADLELKNQVVGWTAYAGGALANPIARKALGGHAKRILDFARKAIRGVAAVE